MTLPHSTLHHPVPTPEEVRKQLLMDAHCHMNESTHIHLKTSISLVTDLVFGKLHTHPSSREIFMYSYVLRRLNTLLQPTPLKTTFTITIPYDSNLRDELRDKGWNILINSADTMEVSNVSLAPHGGYDED